MINEKAPPGRERQVKALKKKFGHDKEGIRRAFAVAWDSYNKSKQKEKVEESSIVGAAKVAGETIKDVAKYAAGYKKRKEEAAKADKAKRIEKARDSMDKRHLRDLAKARGRTLRKKNIKNWPDEKGTSVPSPTKTNKNRHGKFWEAFKLVLEDKLERENKLQKKLDWKKIASRKGKVGRPSERNEK